MLPFFLYICFLEDTVSFELRKMKKTDTYFTLQKIEMKFQEKVMEIHSEKTLNYNHYEYLVKILKKITCILQFTASCIWLLTVDEHFY